MRGPGKKDPWTCPLGPVNLLGAIAQLGERLLCTQEVGSSILPGSTRLEACGKHRAKQLKTEKSRVFSPLSSVFRDGEQFFNN